MKQPGTSTAVSARGVLAGNGLHALGLLLSMDLALGVLLAHGLVYRAQRRDTQGTNERLDAPSPSPS